MSNKEKSLLASILIAGGTLLGSFLTASYFQSKQADSKQILQNVRQMFEAMGTIEGSWIEMEAVEIANEKFTGLVFYGGVTRKEGQASIQYEFYADAKTGAVIDIYPINK